MYFNCFRFILAHYGNYSIISFFSSLLWESVEGIYHKIHLWAGDCNDEKGQIFTSDFV